jgi:hypothetical protein
MSTETLKARHRESNGGQPLIVDVTHSDGYYTAVCDDLHLVTEAKTLDELQARVWELVPELVELNNLPVDTDSMRLRFD